MFGCRRALARSASWIARPVASAAWAIRRTAWPPSRVRCRPSGPAGSVRERHALLDEPRDRLAAVLGDEAGRVLVDEARAGVLGVADVEVDAVVVAEHADDPALGPRRGRLVEAALREHDDRVPVGELEGHREPGEAGAHDDDGCLDGDRRGRAGGGRCGSAHGAILGGADPPRNRPAHRSPPCTRVGQSTHRPPLPAQPGPTFRRYGSGDVLGHRARPAAAPANGSDAHDHGGCIARCCEPPDPPSRREHLERHTRRRRRAVGGLRPSDRSHPQRNEPVDSPPGREPVRAPALPCPAGDDAGAPAGCGTRSRTTAIGPIRCSSPRDEVRCAARPSGGRPAAGGSGSIARPPRRSRPARRGTGRSARGTPVRPARRRPGARG